MRIRAFVTWLAVTLAVVATAPPDAIAHAAPASIDIVVATSSGDEDDTTRPTVNEFFPEERPLSDCLSSLPKPNCGSEARGGWAQTAVFVAILAGLAIIAWRVVAASRRARRDRDASGLTPGRPDATTARDGDGGVPAP